LCSALRTKHLGVAIKRPKQLFNKNTGLCKVENDV
jgi:hypothetical protein